MLLKSNRYEELCEIFCEQNQRTDFEKLDVSHHRYLSGVMFPQCSGVLSAVHDVLFIEVPT